MFALCPELFLASLFHLPLACRTSVFIPEPDVVAAALQTKTAHLASVRWGHVGNDATHHNILDGLAVWAQHGRNLLTKESTPFVHLSLVATLPTAVFQFPGHIQIPMGVFVTSAEES